MLYLQLWQQITDGPTELYSHNSDHAKIKGSNDKECNQMKQGDSGETEEKDCNGSPAYAVCGGMRIITMNTVLCSIKVSGYY